MLRLDPRDETVPLPGKRLNKARLTGILVERDPDLANAEVEPLVEVHVGRVPPHAITERFPRDHLPRLLDQGSKHIRGLGLELNRLIVLSQDAGRAVKRVVPKSQPASSAVLSSGWYICLLSKHGPSPILVLTAAEQKAPPLISGSFCGQRGLH
jgi:hypothetical protein